MLDDQDNASNEDRRASLRVVDLVRSGKGLQSFAPPHEFIWVVRQVNADLAMINQYWVSAQTGDVYQAFPVKDTTGYPSAHSIEQAIAKALDNAHVEKPFEAHAKANVFGNLLPELIATQATATVEAGQSSRLIEELESAKVASVKDARSHVFQYISKNQYAMEANAGIYPNALVRMGVDVKGFSSQGDLVWIVMKLFPGQAMEHVFLIDAKTGRTLSLMEDGIRRPYAKQ